MQYQMSQIAAICQGKLYGQDRVVQGVITDSRSSNVGDNAMFVAMCGVNHNSHAFIEEMKSRGVDSFLVEDSDVVEPQASYIVVDNSIAALQRLAAHHRSLFKGQVVAITGSNGKTMVKEWIAQLLPANVALFRSPRSYNSQIGVALSLLKIGGGEDIALIEAGVSKVGEMERLAQMIQPDTVIFTSIGEAHQEGFTSIEDKISEKLRLAKAASNIIYNSEYSELKHPIEELSCRVIDASGQIAVKGVDVATKRNLQLIASLFELLELDMPDFEKVQSIAMRLDVREGINSSLVINDSYNSDIDSLIIALDYLNSMRSTRATTLILSPILQSATPREELYQNVAKAIERAGVDKLIGVGSSLRQFAHLFKCQKEFYDSTEELLLRLNRDDFASRALLLKGNRDSRFERIMHSLEAHCHTTTLEVNLDVMVDNLNFHRAKLPPQTKVMAMLKANGYGCGDFQVVQTLQAQGVNYIAVAFADEGVTLREKGVTMPIVVLNADDGSFDKMISYCLEAEIYSLRALRDFALAVQRHGEREYPIHLKLDTGMHRLGFCSEEITQLTQQIEQCGDLLRVASIFTHLSSADIEQQAEFTRGQIELFDRLSHQIIEHLGYTPLRHVAASSGIVNYAESHFDMVRLGVGLYGLMGGEGVTPVVTLSSRIVQIKRLKAGESIGYSRSAILSRDSVIATVPIGYADGINRHLGNGRWSMLVNGEPAAIIGRVCMDSVMIDITDIDGVNEGCEVVILSAANGNTPADMAKILDTIPYEVLTSISGRVKRIYVKD